jgi:hypothetical protein
VTFTGMGHKGEIFHFVRRVSIECTKRQIATAIISMRFDPMLSIVACRRAYRMQNGFVTGGRRQVEAIEHGLLTHAQTAIDKL